ncbi:hypothetical protein N9226_00805, partial [bacterium]|nr:hypothetical protein [bacterium]
TFLAMLLRLLNEGLDLVEGLLRNIEGATGIALRRAWFRLRLGSCGAHLRVEPGVHIQGASAIHLGDNVWIDRGVHLIAVGKRPRPEPGNSTSVSAASPGELTIGSLSHVGVNTVIQALGGVRIGDGFTTSAGAKIYSRSNVPTGCRHGTHPSAEPAPSYRSTPVELGSNVWLGLNVCVFGCSIGDDVFVRANSVLLGRHDGNSVLTGDPAAAIGPRFPEGRTAAGQ